jgi:hypothetical protein
MNKLIKRLEAIEQQRTTQPRLIVAVHQTDEPVKVSFNDSELIFNAETDYQDWKRSNKFNSGDVLDVYVVNSPQLLKKPEPFSHSRA